MKKFLVNKLNSKGAISIFITMSVLLAVLIIALGSSSVAMTELKSSLNSSDSTVAYFAAETGIEEAMFVIKGGNNPADSCYAWTSVGDASYCLIVTGALNDGNLIVKSIGEYNTTRRSIQISF
jgi:Tfp pilus assembly protein PilX